MPIKKPSHFLMEKLREKFGYMSQRQMLPKLGCNFSIDVFGRLLSDERDALSSMPKDEQYLEIARKLEISERETLELMRMVLYWRSPAEIRDKLFGVPANSGKDIIPNIAPPPIEPEEPVPDEIRQIIELHTAIEEKAYEYYKATGNTAELSNIIHLQESTAFLMALLDEIRQPKKMRGRIDKSMTASQKRPMVNGAVPTVTVSAPHHGKKTLGSVKEAKRRKKA